MTISPERERQLCAWSTNPADALRAIQFLLARVRELEQTATISVPALQRVAGTNEEPTDWQASVARTALRKLADIGPLPDYPSLSE